MRVERYGEKNGIVYRGENALLTFEILKHADQKEIDAEKEDMSSKVYMAASEIFTIGEYTVASYGLFNNLPHELRILIRDNHLLPEILKKQVRFMYGQGPYLYREETSNKKRIRTPLSENDNDEVWKWLDSWKKSGLLQDFKTYLKLCTQEYYYTEGIFSKWKYNVSRCIGGRLPVRGLEYLPSTRVRLGMKGILMPYDLLEDEQLDLALYGKWELPFRYDYDVFDRFDETDPLRFPVAINYVKDFGFGEEVYSFPTFYYGLKEWIKGSNLNPKYINSYLKNSLSAKLHVIIPQTWIETKTKTLKDICETNRDGEQAGQVLITTYDGLEDIGTTFNYSMVQKLIDAKLKILTEVLSGEGENQGKTFVSRSFRTENGLEEWEFKEIPIKYSEFVTSIINYDKRAVEIIVQGKGIPPSISNVSKEGIFQSSGSEAYYNYLIYLNSLFYAEDFITQDINLALQINFPYLRKERIKLGFFRNIPDKQEDVPPKDRFASTTNPNQSSNNNEP
jgi:hypothetical protein